MKTQPPSGNSAAGPPNGQPDGPVGGGPGGPRGGPPNPLVIEVLTRLGITTQLFHTSLDRRLGAQGLTVAQLSVLSHLSRRKEPQRVTDIADAVEVGQPAVTKMLAKFEAFGWVQVVSAKGDRRSKMAQVTEAGRAHLMQVQRALYPEMGRFLSAWSDDELTRFAQDLTRLGRFLDQQRQSPQRVDAPPQKGKTNAKDEGST